MTERSHDFKMAPRPTGSSEARVVAEEAVAGNLCSIVDRVLEDRAVYVVERGGTPVAEIRPVNAKTVTVRDFVDLVRSGSIPTAGEEYLNAVEEGVAFWNRVEPR